VSAENFCPCALKSVAFSPKKLCGSSPTLLIVTSTMQNWPCAVVPKYWSPISVALQSTPFTTKLNLPSAAGWPIWTSAGASAAASSCWGAAASAEPLSAVVGVALLPPPFAAA
jgi:hypothetical protein